MDLYDEQASTGYLWDDACVMHLQNYGLMAHGFPGLNGVWCMMDDNGMISFSHLWYLHMDMRRRPIRLRWMTDVDVNEA